MDAVLAKKADLDDFQRMIAALESKIDNTSFENLVNVVEGKAEKGEVVVPVVSDKAEMEQFQREFLSDKLDIERQVSELDKKLQSSLSTTIGEIDRLREQWMRELSSKTESSDFDKVVQNLIQKADSAKVQELFSTLRGDLLTQVATYKKELSGKQKSKESELKKKKKDLEF